MILKGQYSNIRGKVASEVHQIINIYILANANINIKRDFEDIFQEVGFFFVPPYIQKCL